MFEALTVQPPPPPPIVYTPRAIDVKWIERERELDLGDYFVRCINRNCYRLRDGRKEQPLEGESRDGVYIYFELK